MSFENQSDLDVKIIAKSPTITNRKHKSFSGINPVDAYVGERLRQRRMQLGLTAVEVGRQIGCSFRQIRKYENGSNRIGAGRLWIFSQLLNVSVSYFFDGMDDSITARSPRMLSLSPRYWYDEECSADNPLQREEARALVQAYYKIANRQAAKRLLNFMQSLAGIHKR